MEPSGEKICTSEVPQTGNSLQESFKLSLEAESYLQSLGFINNGKARFILDEDVAAPSNAAPPADFSLVNGEDSLSFVVLGKSSLDMIQSSSLASYAEIQQKSMSVDYNSIISSLNSTEIHQKLSELLQENSKLKETLKQNNIAMKLQFNTLATWQEEFMKIHHNHKKSFAETRELIKYLKKENAELKMKLSMDSKDNMEMGYKMINDADLEDEPRGEVSVKELQDKISSMTEELGSYKAKCAKLSSDIEKIVSISDLTSSQLKQATSTIQEQRINIKQLEMAVSQSQSKKSNVASCENCSAKDKDIDSLKESVTVLSHKLEHVTTPVQFCIKNPLNPRQYHEQHTQSIKQYNEKLQELNSCFQKQSDRTATIGKLLKELLVSFDIADVFSKLDTRAEDLGYSLLNDQTYVDTSREKLSSCYKKLIDERSRLEEEREHAIKVQQQFQKILLDYKSILHELEAMLGENKDSDVMSNSISREALQNMTELNESTARPMLSLEEERKLLAQERQKFEDGQKLLRTQKAELEVEYKKLNDQKELLQQERVSLNEEKTSLDQQSQLYENHEKALQAEKRVIETKYDQLVSEMNNFTDEIQKKALKIIQLENAVEQNGENVGLLQTQLKFYEEDFEQEKKLKETLQKEKCQLETDLQDQIKFNKQLQTEVTRLKNVMSGDSSDTHIDQTAGRMAQSQGDAVLTPPVMSSFSCPKCDLKFRSVSCLEQHVHRCIDLD